MHYVIDENGNRVESLSKEETLAIIQQAIDNKSLEGIEADSAFVSKLKCCVGSGTFGMAFVTQAKYNELKTNKQLVKDTLYFITDDTTEEILEETIETFDNELKATSKTVEEYLEDMNERLIKLGFKEGSVSLISNVTDITRNYVKRQGNYVVGKIKGICTNISSKTFNIGTIPENFRPSSDYDVGYMGFLEQGGEKEIGYVTISSSGAINVNLGSGDIFATDFEISFGYEVPPIE